MQNSSSSFWDVLIIGSGAAGLAAAVRLHALGISNILLCTEGLRMGTSINTGSDKQTYYKLGLYGSEPDSPQLLASDLMRGGSVHGDLALVEASLSTLAFSHLVTLGVPFPHDEYGGYIGYQTDNDSRRRATSSGPYTSRDMCLALTAELKRRKIHVSESYTAVDLISDGTACYGAIFSDLTQRNAPPSLKTVFARRTVFATGGPGGLYKRSVYPQVHTGAIGLALEAGAKARNLPESQFGLAALDFRWNVSGSYMQALPRFISRSSDGISDEKEFLREYFSTQAEMYNAIFLKGYQWPFSAEHLPGSSMIDLFVYIETVLRGRRVFLDYRCDPPDFHLDQCSQETVRYLEKSGAAADSPLERLRRLNAPALQLFAEHGIHLESKALEIAVCAQHNNGGLAGDLNWESENLKNLFPIGEVNGSHGVSRPGGSALNAGQCGAFRAAEAIALSLRHPSSEQEDVNISQAEGKAQTILAEYRKRMNSPCPLDWKTERNIFQERMDRAGAFVRDVQILRQVLPEVLDQLKKHQTCPLGNLNVQDFTEILRNRQLLTAQYCYLQAILAQIESGTGSRGGAVTLSPGGVPLPGLPEWEIAPENRYFRTKVLESTLSNGSIHSQWTDCHPLPEQNGWFERIWKQYREKFSSEGIKP